MHGSLVRKTWVAAVVIFAAGVPSVAPGSAGAQDAPAQMADVVLDTETTAPSGDDASVDSYIEIDTADVLDAVVSAPGSAASEGSCKPLAAQDLDLSVRDETVAFDGVEASRCNPGGDGAAGYVSWHGKRTDSSGSVLASASLAVLLDSSGAATLTTGTISLADETIEIMPVEGDTYSLTVVGEGDEDDHGDEASSEEPEAPAETPTTPEPEEPAASTTTTEPSGESARTTEPQEPEGEETTTAVIAGDQPPGGGDVQPVEPEPEDLSGAQGDGEADVSPGSIDGGQPRPGGPAGNRTITMRFAYANGMTAEQAYLYMVNRTQQTNDAFINSGMPVRVTANGPVAAGYTQHPSDMGTDLDRMYETDGAMDALVASWQASGLDALALLVPNSTNACGIGFLSTSVEANAPMMSVSAMASGCDYTLTHELGHNLSAHHNPENGGGNTAFPWSYGHSVTGKGRTVMSYANPCGTTGCPRKLQFSDPDNDLLGFPGTPSGTAYRDNDRSITDTSWASSQTGDDTSNDHIWYGSSSGHTSHNVNATYGNDPEAPFTPIAGDFNGDGRSDQLWYFPGRPLDRLWMFNASSGSYSSYTLDIEGAYRPFVGDFDGDSRDDIFWHGPAAAVDSIWWGEASASNFGATKTSLSIAGDYFPQAGDLNGDGKDDVFFYAPGSATDWIWPGNASRSSFAAGVGGVSTAVSGLYHFRTSDVNGDGYEDLVWYGPGSGSDAVWHGRSAVSTIGSSYQTAFTQGDSLLPLDGDFNNDGRGDIFWYGAGSEPDSIWWGQTTHAGFAAPAASSRTVGGTYSPTSGDFNGDGYSDVYWFAFG